MFSVSSWISFYLDQALQNFCTPVALWDLLVSCVFMYIFFCPWMFFPRVRTLSWCLVWCAPYTFMGFAKIWRVLQKHCIIWGIITAFSQSQKQMKIFQHPVVFTSVHTSEVRQPRQSWKWDCLVMETCAQPQPDSGKPSAIKAHDVGSLSTFRFSQTCFMKNL